MNVSKVVNAVGDWLMSRTATQWKIAALVAGIALAYGFIQRHDAAQRAIGEQIANDALTARTIGKLAHIRDSVGKQIDTQTVTLTRVLHRTDTLLRQIPETIVTHEDTVRAIQGLPALRLSTDSAIKACSEYQSLFTAYRTACDSLHYADQAQIRALTNRIRTLQPKRCGVVWSAGFGVVRSGGHLQAGPGVAAGLGCRF